MPVFLRCQQNRVSGAGKFGELRLLRLTGIPGAYPGMGVNRHTFLLKY